MRPPSRGRRLVRRCLLSTLGLGGALALALLVAYALVAARRPAREPLAETLAPGISYRRTPLDSPRPLQVHVVELDLTTPGLRLLVTPGQPAGGRDMTAATTSEFLTRFDQDVAVNGSFFDPCFSTWPWDYYPHTGEPVSVHGLAISDGHTYRPGNRLLPVLCVTGDGRARIDAATCPPGTRQALAGSRLLLHDGVEPAGSAPTGTAPRTAAGVDAEGWRLWLMAVDGRQSGYSEGVTLSELAALLRAEGATEAINLDGGGSTTLVAADGTSGPRLLNAPIHTRIPMRERPVANHLGARVERPRDR